MADDTAILSFEVARRAQLVRLRRRRRAELRENPRDDGEGGCMAGGHAPPSGYGPEGGAFGKRRKAAASAAEPPRLSPTQRRGNDYELRALELLQGAGLRPLAVNLRCRAGEIDLAMRDGDTLVLVEVRFRSDGRFGGAAASIERSKQARLVRAARCVLPRLAAMHWSGREPRVRFDVVAFDKGTPVWLRHAFDAPACG
jgi:putative endonuclease